MGEQSVVLPPMLVEAQKDDELCKSLFVTDIGYYPKARGHHRIRQVPIDQYVLIYCVDGSGYFSLDGKRREVSKGQWFVLPAGRPHEYGAGENGWTIYWIHFHGEHAHIFAEGAGVPQNIHTAVNSRIKDRIEIFEEILATLRQGTSMDDLRYVSSLLHHFLASMHYLAQYRKSGRNKMERQLDSPVESAIHYMRENIGNRVVMDDVLRYVGFSQSHFSTLFKQATGMSPMAYLNRLKVEHVCRLLETTDLKLNQICYKVGIEDPLYLSRLFSKLMGMSPTRYRSERNC